jgi:hypothetical protein
MRRRHYVATRLPLRGMCIAGSQMPAGPWWTGLDSNQRTENRADLQSAAFNHSATCPSAPLGEGGSMAKGGGGVNAALVEIRAPFMTAA